MGNNWVEIYIVYANIAATIISMKTSPAVLKPDSSPGPGLPQGCTNFQLRQLMRRVSQHYDAEMSRIGLKTTQYSLLSHIVKLGPIRPGDLAAVMKMEPSTLTRNLKPLVSAGWVEQVAGDDGRSRSITITESGREKRTEAQRRWKVAQLGLNQTLGVERVAALHSLIQESLELLKPLAGGDDDV
jgi:DNA-binding MarR family transcriptional regulator